MSEIWDGTRLEDESTRVGDRICQVKARLPEPFLLSAPRELAAQPPAAADELAG